MTAIQGCDYSFGRPSPTKLYAAGYRFAVRYLSGGTSPKDLTRPEYDALHAAGLAVAVVWEVGGIAAAGGYAQGVADAHAADAQATALGLPGVKRPIYFAIDTDLDVVRSVAYIRGAASVLGFQRTGVYGGYKQVKACLDARACAWAWQTLAWSRVNGVTKWDTRAHMRQVGSSAVDRQIVDDNIAGVVDYGQWPQPVAPKPVKPASPPPTVVPVWHRDLPRYSSGADVNELLRHVTPEGPAQLAYAALRKVKPIYDSASFRHVEKYQRNRPLLWGELRRHVVGAKTWKSITGHA